MTFLTRPTTRPSTPPETAGVHKHTVAPTRFKASSTVNRSRPTPSRLLSSIHHLDQGHHTKTRTAKPRRPQPHLHPGSKYSMSESLMTPNGVAGSLELSQASLQHISQFPSVSLVPPIDCYAAPLPHIYKRCGSVQFSSCF